MKKTISIFLSFVILITCLNTFTTSSVSANTRRAYGIITTSGTKVLDKKVDKWLSDISNDMSDYEKALYAYIKLIENCAYNACEKESSTAYGAIVNEYAQCGGFADGYSYLLDKLNIPNRIVYSRASNHAWNLVKIEGKWYHCEPTNEKLGAFLIGNKSLYKLFNGKNYKGWYVDDGRSRVKASDSDYNGKAGKITLEDGKKVMLHSQSDITIVNGWFYYTPYKRYTEEEKEKYNISSDYVDYSYLEKTKCGKTYAVISPSELLKHTNGNGVHMIGAGGICNNTIYFFSDGPTFPPWDFEKYGQVTETIESYNVITKEFKVQKLVFKDKSTLGDSTKACRLRRLFCHNAVKNDIKPTYSNYGTSGRMVCKDCGYIVVTGKRAKPLKINSKPSVKYSNKTKGKITLSFSNKYYNEKSAVIPFQKSGGYQIAYRKVGAKSWTYRTYFSTAKNAKRILKFKFKTKYQFKVRYTTITGENLNATPIRQYGKWSDVKSFKIK